ncbi:MAG: glycoside hydrolase family 127 protein [Clostridia bacterium]|nr:glycoside hydrolase family 127 protein [Clostridia bacterium]
MKTHRHISPVAYSHGKGFTGAYQKLIKDKVIPYQYNVLNDLNEDTEKSHVVKNFINAARALKGEDTDDGFYGMVFQDSDAAKWLEAVAFSLALFPDDELEKTADTLIDIIAAAQDEDGYLNTYYTIKDKDKRWTNILEGHELYCSGHFIEAACSYYEATGKNKLLGIMKKNADHIYDVFINGGHKGYPGHPEIELALLRLYDVTKEEKYLTLAKHFIDIRGVDPHYYEKERQSRDWTVWNGDGRNHYYQQSYAPVREQKDADGHSVRAVYLYTAMADLASQTDDTELYDACKNLWNSIVRKRMYITGAIGSTVHGEAFTVDYDLPSDTVYGETCASIGLMFFARQMLQNELKGEYADVMERAFFNTILAGMEITGERFFYVNPLEIIPGISGKACTHHHTLTQRPKWYTCACCPPNAARLISSLGTYAYGEKDDTCFCHLFCDGRVKFENGVALTCETEYPYDFTVKYTVSGKGSLAVRIPSWSKTYSLKINSEKISPEKKDGYIYFEFTDGDSIELTLDGTPKFIYADRKVPTLTGMAAVMRGPLVYCFEGVDNNGEILSLSLKRKGAIKEKDITDATLGKTVMLEIEGYKVECEDTLYSENEPTCTPCTLKAVPYYLWGNRGENQMRVWMNLI